MPMLCNSLYFAHIEENGNIVGHGIGGESGSGQEGAPCALAHLCRVLSTLTGQGTLGGKFWDM